MTVILCSTQGLEQVRPLIHSDGGGSVTPECIAACWILDCYDTFKAAAQYYGIDISSNLYPTLGETLGSSIHLSEGNILTPKGKWAEQSYKLVNQRLLIAALSAEDWKTVIGNIYNMLSPGGWVQLVEADHCHSGEATQRHRDLVLKRVFEKRGLLLDPVYDIPALLRDTGFANVNTKACEISLGKWAGNDGVEARDNCIGLYRGMKDPVVKVMGILSSSEFDALIDDMEREWDNNQGSKVRYNVFYAQKPASV